MMKRYLYYLAPFFVLSAFIVDGQLTTLLTNLSSGGFFITSHLLLIMGIFLSFCLPLSYSLVLYTVMGLFYDLYYFGVVGMAVTLFPLVIYLVYYFYENLRFRRITNHIILLVIIFVVEFFSFLLARFFQLTNLSMFIFVFNNLVPSLLFNSAFLLVLHPILKSLFVITNKT